MEGRRRHVSDLADRRAVERFRPAEPETVAEAVRLKEAALLDFGLTESAVASVAVCKVPPPDPDDRGGRGGRRRLR